MRRHLTDADPFMEIQKRLERSQRAVVSYAAVRHVFFPRRSNHPLDIGWQSQNRHEPAALFCLASENSLAGRLFCLVLSFLYMYVPVFFVRMASFVRNSVLNNKNS